MITDAMIAEKYCNGCKRTLPVSMFTKSRREKDGLNYRCKDCVRKQSQKYINSERGKNTRKAYYRKTKDAVTKKQRLDRNNKARKHREKYPEKYKARRLVGMAVKRGFIPRPGPVKNWGQTWEFHHPDYTRPYYGCFIKQSEHRAMESGKIPFPEMVDYTEDVLTGALVSWGFSELDAKLIMAFKEVDRMRELGYYCKIRSPFLADDNAWWVYFEYHGTTDSNPPWVGKSENPAMAICEAAYAAVSGET